jgi:hypothetical protein
MSNTPDPDINLDLHFLPAWARQSSEVNRYAHYEGSEGGNRRGGGRRPRPEGGGPRDRSRDDRPRRGEGGRPQGQGRDQGRGPGRGPRRSGPGGPGGVGRPREEVRLPDVRVSFVPELRGVESLARQIKVTGRAYPVFEIAQLILSKPERYQVTFEVLKKPDGTVAQELWHCSIDNTLWLSRDEALAHVYRRHFDMFYQAEKTPTDPPKGTYTFVAQCGFSGVILGPPNYHDYQVKLRKLHATRFSRMPLESYQAKIRIVRDEEVVKQWVEEQSFKTEYVCLNVAEPLKLENREAAEKHFREVHAGALVQSVDTWTAPPGAAQQLPQALLKQLVRRNWEEQRRFPLKLVTVLSQQMAGHALQFFKVNKTVTHVCVARPHFLDLEASPVSDGVRKIVEFIRAHEGCTRRDLVEALAPTPKQAEVVAKPEEAAAPDAAVEKAGVGEAAPAEGSVEQGESAAPEAAAEAKEAAPAAPAPKETKPTAEQTAVVGDLHWLIHQGHVIEFANGRLETAKKPKPKPEPKKAAAPKPVPAAVPAEGSQDTVPAAAASAESAGDTTGEGAAVAAAEATPEPAVGEGDVSAASTGPVEQAEGEAGGETVPSDAGASVEAQLEEESKPEAGGSTPVA